MKEEGEFRRFRLQASMAPDSHRGRAVGEAVGRRPDTVGDLGATEPPHSEGDEGGLAICICKSYAKQRVSRSYPPPRHGAAQPKRAYCGLPFGPFPRCHSYPACQSACLLPPRPDGRLNSLDNCRVILLTRETHRPTLSHIYPPPPAPSSPPRPEPAHSIG